MFCPKCGSRLPDDAVFCGRCGTEIRTKDYYRDEPEMSRTPKKSRRKKNRLPLVILILLLPVLAAAAFLYWQVKSRQAETGTEAFLQAADEPMKTP